MRSFIWVAAVAGGAVGALNSQNVRDKKLALFSLPVPASCVVSFIIIFLSMIELDHFRGQISTKFILTLKKILLLFLDLSQYMQW
jgi:hypothetical protein